MGCCNPKKSEEDKFNIAMQTQATLEKVTVTFQDMSLTSHNGRFFDENKYTQALRSSRSSIEASFLHLQDESMTPKFGVTGQVSSRKKHDERAANKENDCGNV